MSNFKILFSRLMGIGEIQRQSIMSLFSQIGFTLIGFMSTIYFARVVGAGVLGAYFLFLAYLSIVGLVSDGGFGGAAIKRISEGEEQDAYFSAFVLIRTIFVIMVIIALILFRKYFVDLNNGQTFIWFLLALIASLLQGAISNGMQGLGKLGVCSTSNFIDNVSRTIVQIGAVFLGYGIAGLAGGFIVGVLVGSLVQMHFFELHFAKFSWEHIKSLSNFSFWIFLISGGMIVFSSSDTIIIGHYLGDVDVGIYRVVMQFTSIATFTTVAIRSVLYPRISRWGKIAEIGLIEQSLSRAFTYSFILAIPILAGGFLLGDKLLYYFYGADFEKGYMTMNVLFLVQIANIFQFFFTSYLIALGRLKDLFKITVVAVVANIVLNILFIPLMGIIGAAIATFVTIGFNAIAAMWVLSKIIKIKVEYDCLLSIIKATIAMSLIVGGYRLVIPMTNIWMVLIPVVLGSVIYMITIFKLSDKVYEELKGIINQMLYSNKQIKVDD